jgi:hypothetical protein
MFQRLRERRITHPRELPGFVAAALALGAAAAVRPEFKFLGKTLLLLVACSSLNPFQKAFLIMEAVNILFGIDLLSLFMC